jgi:hypothetical protein
MKVAVSDEVTNPDGNTIIIPTHMQAGLQQTTPREWEYLFKQFRLNLQNRIPGADDRGLVKVQGNMELMAELEKFFKEAVGKPVG